MIEILSALVVAKLKVRVAALAVRLGTTLLVLAVVGLTFGVLLVGGAVAGSSAVSASAVNSSGCGTDNFASAVTANGPSSAAVTLGGVPFTTDQLANAAVIVAVGHQLGAPQLAVESALITALQESGLQNLAYGDADSVGLFQQRPSMGWGTVEQILQPDYSSTRFYQALMAIPDYQQQTAPWLAQAVQRSAFPDRYANWTQTALQLLGVPSVGSASCLTASGAAGAAFGTGPQEVTLPRANPRTPEEAIAWAEAEAASGSSTWYRACLGFVAQAYGWGFSGTYYAIDQYRSVIPVSLHHDLDRNPEPGALLFWETSGRAGHVAIYLGNGNIASNDILEDGHISIVPASLIEQKWGAKYVGWAPPYFPTGG